MGYTEISTRISLRWLPSAPSEPTDTLVYNVGTYFLDLRVLKDPGNTIDWAMAGVREVLSLDPLKCRWIHTIDSHGQTGAPDEGSFSTLPNGDSLESGSMACPDRDGAVTPYEEVWRVLLPLAGPRWAWVLQSSEDEDEDDGGKTFLARIGGGYIALCEGKEGFGARREEWDSKGDWTVKYALGDVRRLPSMKEVGELVDGEEGWTVGDVVRVGGRQFVVRAYEKLGS